MDFNIGNVEISQQKVTIIAEAGVNHNGSIHEAKELALEAKKAGADIVKFQTYKSSKLSSPKAEKFWNKNSDTTVYQSETYSGLDNFDKHDYLEVKNYCDSIDIEFMSTPFDLESVEMLADIGVRGFKIASCDITNNQLIRKIAETELPILLSTGASDINEICNAVELISSYHEKFSLLHCILSYPTLDKDANIKSIPFLAKHFPGVVLGYSDHTREIYSAFGAVALGARVIEKHFTLQRNMTKPGDHWFAIDPDDLKELAHGSRVIIDSLGIEHRNVLDCELIARKQARRSIHMARKVDAGAKAVIDDFIMLRPGTGLSAKMLDVIVGKTYKRDLDTFDILDLENLS